MTASSSSSLDLEALRMRAERTLIERQKLPDPDPVIIEFSGSPKAGKTTAIDIVNHFFRRNGFKVWAPSEGASKRTPYDLRRDLVSFNAWSLNYAIAEVLLASNDVHRYDLAILDRGPFDSLAWMGVLRDRGDLSQEEYEIIRAYALHQKWMSKLARVFLLTCNPETSMEREHDSKLITRPGTAMNPEMLSALLEQYKQLQVTHSAYPVSFKDTSADTGTTPLVTAAEITSEILTLFESGRE